MPIRRRKVEELVAGLLTNLEMSEPPVPIERIAKARGIHIFLQSLDDSVSGFLFRNPKRTVIGVNTHHPRVRQRFTLAHELGHFLLHTGDVLHVDHGFQLLLRNKVSSQGVNEDEMEANLFAAELLMPRRMLEADLRKLGAIEITDDRVLSSLARRFGVSVQALLIRLTSLGYISPRTQVTLAS